MSGTIPYLLSRYAAPTVDAITEFLESDPDEVPWIHGVPPKENIRIGPHDPTWAKTFETLASDLRKTLGAKALRVDHIGSTSVPGLIAKPIIDIDLIVADPSAESQYIPDLVKLGYVHILREPSWYHHRGLRLENPRVTLHVFGPNSPENIRHLMFRDWLRQNPEDRKIYEEAKAKALEIPLDSLGDYNRRKADAILAIYKRIFAARGLPH